MAKTYVGVGDTAHKVKKMYVGVDGVAKKVKKAYVGVNGVARKIFSGNDLESYTWQEIAEIAKSGNASKVFNIGDTKLMYNAHADTGQTIATIIGFDHDIPGYTSSQTYPRDTLGITFMVTPLHWTGNFLKWDGSTTSKADYMLYSQSYIRQLLNNYNFSYGNAGNNWEDNFFHELGPLMFPTVKYTRGKYSILDTREDHTQGELFIPSEWEIYGTAPNSMDGDSTKPKEQYQYFKDGGSTILYDESGNPASWWLRSDPNQAGKRCYVDVDGTVKIGDCFAADYMMYCFCL